MAQLGAFTFGLLRKEAHSISVFQLRALTSSVVHFHQRSFEDGLKLVKLRGESMQAASDASPSGMVSVIGLDAEKVPFNFS